MCEMITSLITPPFYKDNVKLLFKPGVPSCHVGVVVWFREGGRCHCPSVNTSYECGYCGCWWDSKTDKPSSSSSSSSTTRAHQLKPWKHLSPGLIVHTLYAPFSTVSQPCVSDEETQVSDCSCIYIFWLNN